MSKSPCSEDTKEKIKAFQEADVKFRLAWEQFENENATKLAYIDKLREERNAKLDEAKRAIRQDAEMMDAMRATFTEGPFRVQKKWSDFYIPDKFVHMISERGLYDAAISAKVVAIRTEIAPYSKVKQFLEDHGIAKDFECCEDGAESSTAISGPKSVPPLAAELKKE